MTRTRLAVIVIGRNEGPRLVRCLASVATAACRVVYVDSGSTDDSVAAACAAGAEVVALDMSTPFTAARARNAGSDRVLATGPAPDFLHFVDGDCEVQPGWIDTATAFLDRTPKAAVVAGRLRERHPEASVYNRLCAQEWHVPEGETQSIGGIFLCRTEAFREAGGFRPEMVGGEEPELCFRLRAAGWQVWRLPDAMALHDADMHRFGQWWRRMVRGGWAAAHGFALHGRSAERYNARMVARILFWGAAVPAGILGALLLALAWPPALAAAAVGIAAYPVMALRIARRRMRETGEPARHALAYGAFTMLGKLAELQGALRFWRGRRGATR